MAAIVLHNACNSSQRLSLLQRSLKDHSVPEGFLVHNARHKREVEVTDEDRQQKEVILGCYFIHQKDPNLGITRRAPDIEYIGPWYDSVKKLGRYGIIIHDGLDPDFIRRYETEHIKFRKYTGGDYSIFEERWFAYYMWLSATSIQRAFIADINDVYITKDPFSLSGHEYTLYVGRDNANKIKDSGWIQAEMEQFSRDAHLDLPRLLPYQYTYNAGVVGGSRSVLLLLMSHMIRYTMLTCTSVHKDMTLLNLFIFLYYRPKIDTDLTRPRLANREDDLRASNQNLITGYPFNSDFQKLQLNSDAYFIHK